MNAVLSPSKHFDAPGDGSNEDAADEPNISTLYIDLLLLG